MCDFSFSNTDKNYFLEEHWKGKMDKETVEMFQQSAKKKIEQAGTK